MNAETGFEAAGLLRSLFSIGLPEAVKTFTLQIEVFLALLIYLRCLPYEKHRLSVRIGGFLGMFLLPLFLTYTVACMSPGLQEASLPVVLVYCFSTYACAILFAWSSREMKLIDAFYIASCAYLTQHFARCLYTLLSGALAEVSGILNPVRFLCILFVYGICFFYFSRLLIEDSEKQRRSRQGLMTTFIALSIAILMSAVAQQRADESSLLYSVCMIYGMVCCFYVLWDQAARKQQQNLKEELDMQRQTFQKYKDQYQMSQENVALINRKCHDLKHQIAALRHIKSEEQRTEQINSLEESVMIYDSMVQTGNEILDTILTEKSLYCEANGITLTCVADGKSAAFLDPVDLYTIFGNALDNALECVSSFAEPEKRVISVIVTSRANILLFQFENYYEQQLKITSDGYATSKEDKGYHGFGLKSIRYAAEKYGGYMNVETENGIFLLRVILPAMHE